MSIAIAIIEDDRQTREDLVALCRDSGELKCVGAYASAEAALEQVPLLKPDVAVIDINLGGMSGIACTARLKQKLPSLAVLILTTYSERDLIFDALRAGATGYMLKKSAPDELLPAIRQVHAGGAPMSMQIARKVVDFFSHVPAGSGEVTKLTPRERQVLDLLAKGHRYKEIMAELNLSLSTVRTHLRHIYEKLHVESRTEATAKYLTGH